MSTRKKNTLIDISLAYLNNAIAFVNGILIVPFYFSYIDTVTYGAWLATGNVLTWLTILDLGTGTVTKQRISKTIGEGKNYLLGFQVASSLLISFCASTVALIIGLFLSSYIHMLIDLSDPKLVIEVQEAFRIAMIAVSVSLFGFSVNAILIGFQKQFYAGVSRTVGRVFGIGVSVTLVFTGCSIKSIAYGVLLTNIIELIINLIFFKVSFIPLRFSKRYFKHYSKIFSITFFSKFLESVYTNIDLLLVARFLGPTMVTQLEVTRRPLKFIQGFLLAPSKSIMPTLSNYLGQSKIEQSRILIEKLLITFFCMFISAGVGFALFNESLVRIWVGADFFIGQYKNMFLSVGLLITMWNFLLMSINVSLGNIRGNSYNNIIKSVIGIGLLLLLGYLYKLTGVIIAPIITIIICQLWYYLSYLQRKIQLSMTFWVSILKIIVLGIAIGITAFFVFERTEALYGNNYSVLLYEIIIFGASTVIIFMTFVKEFRALLYLEVIKPVNKLIIHLLNMSKASKTT